MHQPKQMRTVTDLDKKRGKINVKSDKESGK